MDRIPQNREYNVTYVYPVEWVFVPIEKSSHLLIINYYTCSYSIYFSVAVKQSLSNKEALKATLINDSWQHLRQERFSIRMFATFSAIPKLDNYCVYNMIALCQLQVLCLQVWKAHLTIGLHCQSTPNYLSTIDILLSLLVSMFIGKKVRISIGMQQ